MARPRSGEWLRDEVSGWCAAGLNAVVCLLETDGAGVAIHCRAGIGRSSLIAACVLLKLGTREDEIFPLLSRVRGVAVPDTSAQIQWLSKFRRESETTT